MAKMKTFKWAGKDSHALVVLVGEAVLDAQIVGEKIASSPTYIGIYQIIIKLVQL